MPVDEDVIYKVTNQQHVLVTIESHMMNVELNSGTNLQSRAELQTKAETHFGSEISLHERYVELPNIAVKIDSKVVRPKEEKE